MKIRFYFAFFLLIVTSQVVIAQSKVGFYMDWNIDHTERSVKPSIQIFDAEARTINCYKVFFDDANRFERVQFFFSGKPSNYGNYGAFELERTYYSGFYIDKFKDTDGNYVSVEKGVTEKKYHLNPDGFWFRKEHLNEGEQLENGVAYSKVTRNANNELETEIQFSKVGDTIPDGNGFPIVHFAYDKNGLTLYRQSRTEEGKIVNGQRGYATVIFQFNEDGMFFEEQFLDENNELFLHPQFDLAKINWREFNKYGKPTRIYYIDSFGYPHKQRAYAVISYRNNMTRESISYYDNVGERTGDRNGVHKSIYNYNTNGKFVGRSNFDLNGKEI